MAGSGGAWRSRMEPRPHTEASLAVEKMLRMRLEVDATWRPHISHGELSREEQEALPKWVFAFPWER